MEESGVLPAWDPHPAWHPAASSGEEAWGPAGAVALQFLRGRSGSPHHGAGRACLHPARPRPSDSCTPLLGVSKGGAPRPAWMLRD